MVARAQDESHPARLRDLLVEESPDALFALDAAGIIRYATPAAGRLLRIPHEGLVGSGLARLFRDPDAASLDRARRAALEVPGETFRVEVQLRHPEELTVEFTLRAASGPTGEPLLLAVGRDSTQRRRAEDALREQEARYRMIFEDDLTGDFVTTPEGRVLACNTAFAEILGYESVEEALTVRASDFYLDPAIRDMLVRRLRESKQLKHLEIDLRRKDGRSLHVILNVVGTFDERGELVSVRGNLFDITEQRRLADERTQLLVRERAARALAEAAERQAAFLAEVGSALDTSLDYRETLSKLAHLVVPTLADFCLIHEQTSEARARRVAFAHVDPESSALLCGADSVVQVVPELVPQPVQEVLETGQPVLAREVTDEVLDQISGDDGLRETLQALGIRSYIVVPLTARGRTLGAITLASSVSGRRFTKRDVEVAGAVAKRAALSVDNARLYSRAQQAARTREEVLAFVSHDLRNPLATILLNASALLETVPPERLRADEREQLEWIARSSEQMNRMIQDLLEVARIDSGRLPIRQVPTEIEPLLQEAGTLLAPLIQGGGLRLETEALPAGPPAYVDRERCLRVLSNLIGNAIQFTPAGGQIRVSAEISDGMYRVAVADTGVGIAPEDAGRLFELYGQGRHTPTNGNKRGNGLGLVIAKGIVEAHGGTIWFESTPGRGATFYFTVPIATEQRSGSASPSQPA